MDRDPSVLVRVGSALGRYGDLLLVHGATGVDHAVLEDDGCVAKNEVNCAVDVTFFVELALGVDVEGVLVPLEGAPVEDGEVGARAKGYCLVVLRARGVAKCYAAGDESLSGHS